MHIHRKRIVNQIHVRFPKAFDRTDIFPVSVKIICDKDLFVRQHIRNDVFTEVIGTLLVFLILSKIVTEFFPGEDIYAHGCFIALRVFRFFLKLNNRSVGIRVHNSETGRFFPGNFTYGNGSICAMPDVIVQHRIVIHFVNMVAAEDQDIIRMVLLYKSHILIDGICRSAVPFSALSCLVRRQNKNASVRNIQIPRRAAADIGIKLKRLILRQNADCINTAVCAVA